ncbi:MAG: alpha/beta fold hydrolase [Streptosporangiaceae bacterium]
MAPSSLVPTSQTLAVPGARLYYEVRGTGPLVVLVGAPMDAGPFGALAELLAADYTVLTTDLRGINRSPVDDPGQDSTPEMRADDLSRLVALIDLAAELGIEPTMFPGGHTGFAEDSSGFAARLRPVLADGLGDLGGVGGLSGP